MTFVASPGMALSIAETCAKIWPPFAIECLTPKPIHVPYPISASAQAATMLLVTRRFNRTPVRWAFPCTIGKLLGRSTQG